MSAHEEEAFDPAEEHFSQDAIEEAYLQALKASEEAGLIAEVAYTESQSYDYEEELAAAGFAEATSSSGEKSASPSHAQHLHETAPRQQFLPRQIIEALLFVGGEKLSARKMASLLGQHCEETSVRTWVEELNARYLQQNRPYEIILGEEGYQMSLRFEYQPQRHQLFGLGPREVKLSQEALEVLAFIAYRQPATQEEILEIDRPQVLSTLRQLVRRELVTVERREEDKAPVYRTTSRFLKVFGLTQLTDLPRSRDLTFK